MFEPGSRVRIKERFPPGHIRTPYYLRGKTGVIERSVRAFRNPEALAYGLKADQKMLYRVRFTMDELWGQSETSQDTLDAEIYEHWLEPA